MTHTVTEQVDDAILGDESTDLNDAKRVLANPRFLALFVAQVLTQVGGNMVLYGLTIQVLKLTGLNTSVSLLLLTFLVPAVIFGAVAGVFVDRYDRRGILVLTNVSRGLLYLVLVFVDDQLALLYLVTAVVGTLTTFFAPAESAMIPVVVPRPQLLAANGLFILGLQVSFVLGFAVLGPLFLNLFGLQLLIAFVAICYLLAGLLCAILPKAPPTDREMLTGDATEQARRAIRATVDQLVEGLVYIREHRRVFWSLVYLSITASLIGVLGVLGPGFAKYVLGLSEDDFVIIVLPLGAGLVFGILLINAYGRLFTRRRLIEGGLAVLAVTMFLLGIAERAPMLQDSTGIVSLLTVVIVVAFAAGVAYPFIAVPAQTSLQEELPSEVRGRVFGVLNTLISVASFVPIIIVGPLADLIDTVSHEEGTGVSVVILACSVILGVTGVLSYLLADPDRRQGVTETLGPVDQFTVSITSSTLARPSRLRYLDADIAAEADPRMLASPVVPGVAGPAGMRVPVPIAYDPEPAPPAGRAPAAVAGATPDTATDAPAAAKAPGRSPRKRVPTAAAPAATTEPPPVRRRSPRRAPGEPPTSPPPAPTSPPPAPPASPPPASPG